jgi:hypothetical protein
MVFAAICLVYFLKLHHLPAGAQHFIFPTATAVADGVFAGESEYFGLHADRKNTVVA